MCSSISLSANKAITPPAHKKKVFTGTVLVIEGVEDLRVEEAFELSDASAERSAAASTVKMSVYQVTDTVKGDVVVLRQMVAEGYGDSEALERPIDALTAWLSNPELLAGDEHAEYKVALGIDLSALTEPTPACPNDPDDVRLLSRWPELPLTRLSSAPA